LGSLTSHRRVLDGENRTSMEKITLFVYSACDFGRDEIRWRSEEIGQVVRWKDG